jgi:hypothetical protein
MSRVIVYFQPIEIYGLILGCASGIFIGDTITALINKQSIYTALIQATIGNIKVFLILGGVSLVIWGLSIYKKRAIREKA